MTNEARESVGIQKGAGPISNVCGPERNRTPATRNQPQHIQAAAPNAPMLSTVPNDCNLRVADADRTIVSYWIYTGLA